MRRASGATAFTGFPTNTSPRYCRERAPEIADGRVVVAHLGNGCSACAMQDRAIGRDDDGVHRARRVADGHPLRRARCRRGAVPHPAEGHVAGGGDRPPLQPLRHARPVGGLVGFPRAAGQRGAARALRGRGVLLLDGAPYRLACGRARRAWTGSCSPPGSARMRRRSGPRSAVPAPGSGWRLDDGGQPAAQDAHQRHATAASPLM